MLKSFQLEDILHKRMSASIAAVEDMRNRLSRVKALVAPVSEVLSGVAIGAVVLYASLNSRSNPESIGALFSFITALLLAGEPIRRLSRMHIDLSIAAERIAMLYQLLDQAQVEPRRRCRPALQVKTGDITFQDVSFTYPGAKKRCCATSRSGSKAGNDRAGGIVWRRQRRRSSASFQGSFPSSRGPSRSTAFRSRMFR